MRHVQASTLKHLNTSVYSPYGETITDRFSVCSRMSSHYRRVYSSRNVVDTSPPRSFGLRHGALRIGVKNNRNLSGGVDQSLVDAVVYDSQNSPSTYSLCKGRKSGGKHVPAKPMAKLRTSRTSMKCREPYDLMERHAGCFVAPTKAFQPRILKTEAESKIRLLRTYHPPRIRDKRRMIGKKNVADPEGDEEGYLQDEWELADEEIQQMEDAKVRSDSAQSHAKASSCDSAYSGGASSGRESCGVSPDQRQDDVRYVKFIHEITEDVLRRGVFTNKGLQLLFQRHIEDNESVLSKERMAKEVLKLSEELGMCDEVVSSFGNLNMAIHDGSARSFMHGNKEGVLALQTGREGGRQDAVATEDKLSGREKCRSSRTCTPFASDLGKCSCGSERVCVCDSVAAPRNTAAEDGSRSFGSEVVDSQCGRCSCKRDPKMQRFWTSVSNKSYLLTASGATEGVCCRGTLSRDSTVQITDPRKITSCDKHLQV